MAGTMRVMRPGEILAEMMSWVKDFLQGQISMIGILEALRLILPALTGILPGLVALATAATQGIYQHHQHCSLVAVIPVRCLPSVPRRVTMVNISLLSP